MMNQEELEIVEFNFVKTLKNWLADWEDDPGKIRGYAKSDIEKAEVKDGKLLVRVDSGVGPHLLVYLNEMMDDLYPKIYDKGAKEMVLNFSSAGGYVFSGLKAVNLVKEWNKTKDIKLSFLANSVIASMAVPIYLEGWRRYSYSNTMFLIHGVSGIMFGKIGAFKDYIKSMEILQDYIAKAIVSKTEFTEDEVNDMMSHDTYLSVKEAKEKGMVQEIIDTDVPDGGEDYAEGQKKVVAREKTLRNMTLKLMEV